MKLLTPVFLPTLLIYGLFTSSCQDRPANEPSAHAIVQTCIEAHGGQSYEMMDISYDFRKYRIRLKQDHGKFIYERTYKDSLQNSWKEILTNEGLQIEKNKSHFLLSDTAKNKILESINAMAYFALLPFKLADEAVLLTYAGSINIENREYDKVSVSFKKQGGGKDHEDEFCYWIDKKTHQLQFLAYSNGGPRFRKAIGTNTCGGVIVLDYENYAMTDSTINTENYDSAYIQGKLKMLSKIEQTNFRDNLKGL